MTDVRRKRLRYFIYAASYSPDRGGTIFLHELVRTLRQLGEEAYIWPMERLYRGGRLESLKSMVSRKRYLTAPGLEEAIASPNDLGPQDVIVYPEIVPGNPLAAKNVVRWLLYKPGGLLPYEFGEDELFFRAGEFCDLPGVIENAPDLFMWKINEEYKNLNNPNRRGVCYIIRKGHAKKMILETEAKDAVCIDGLSHAEINQVFNQKEYFYSYDEATMYSQYAALCGCISIVVPGLYASREEWVKSHAIGRFGVAYGTDDIEHARSTRAKVKNLLAEEEKMSRESVRLFIDRTYMKFRPDKE